MEQPTKPTSLPKGSAPLNIQNFLLNANTEEVTDIALAHFAAYAMRNSQNKLIMKTAREQWLKIHNKVDSLLDLRKGLAEAETERLNNEAAKRHLDALIPPNA